MTPFARFDNLEPEKKARILEAATDEFAHNGYEVASLNKIIAAAKISKGSFYYYFEDKLDLLVAVLRHNVDVDKMLPLGELCQTQTREAFWASLRQTTFESVGVMQDDPRLFALVTHLASIPPAMLRQGALGMYVAEMMHKLDLLLTHGQDISAVRTDLPMSLLLTLWAGVDQIFDRWILSEWSDLSEEERAGRLDVTLDAFQRLFSP